MSKTAKHILFFLLSALAAGVFQLFLVLCLLHLRERWGEAAFLSLVVAGSVLNAALYAVQSVCYLKGKETVYKLLISCYVLLVLGAVILYILLRTGFMEIARDEEALKAYLERAGVWMGAAFIVLQYLQVVVLPIPSFVTVAAGTALFGPLRCALYSLLGIVLGSLTAFFIGRCVGHRAVAWMIGKDTLDKWLEKIKGKDKLLLSAMFLLPVFPDDILCFVAGLSSMSFVFFLVVILISRVIAIFTTCYSVTLIPFDTWWGITLWVVLFLAVCVLFFVLYKKADAIQAWLLQKFRRLPGKKDADAQERDGKPGGAPSSRDSVEIVPPRRRPPDEGGQGGKQP